MGTDAHPDGQIPNYGSDADPEFNVDHAFAELDRLVAAAFKATAAREELEARVERAQRIETDLLTRQIPLLLEKMRQKEVTTWSGVKVTLKRDIKASLPGQDRPGDRAKAIQWLIDHGHGGVVKNAIRVHLDRGEDSRADSLVAELIGKGLEVDSTKDVHVQTLGALVRELITAGTLVPKEIFNLYDAKVAKLVRK